MIPRDEFWGVMETYGARIVPAQIVFYLAAILSVGWLFLKPGRIQGLVAKLYLSIAFAWNGVVFYFTLAKDMAGESYGNSVQRKDAVLASSSQRSEDCYIDIAAVGVLLPTVRHRIWTWRQEPYRAWHVSVPNDSSWLAPADNCVATG